MSESNLEITRLTRQLVAEQVLMIACAVLTLCAVLPIVLLAFQDSSASTSHNLQVLFTSLWIPVMPAFSYCICRWRRAVVRRKLQALDSDIRIVSIT